MRWMWQGKRKWLLIGAAILLLLWMLPRLYRELLPVNSRSMMREARATAEAIEPAGNRAVAMAHIARALVHADDLRGARQFAQNAPLEVQPFAWHAIGHALLDTNRLDDALEVARHIHRQYGSYHARQNVAGHQVVDDDLPNSALLFQRLIRALIEAGRFNDALEVVRMLQADKQAKDKIPLYLRSIVRRAAEVDQFGAAARAMDQSPQEALDLLLGLRLARLALQAGDYDRAEQWLQRLEELPSTERNLLDGDISAPLPPEWEDRVRQVNALAQRGQTARALTLAERTLRDYLNRHDPSTIDFKLLARLTARLTAPLPSDATQRMLNRLPVERYERAKVHLETGFCYGLALSGRERELEQFLAALNDPWIANRARELLILSMAAQGRTAQVRRLLSQVESPIAQERLRLEAALRYARTGRVQEARQLLQMAPSPSMAQRLRRALESLQQPPLALPAELIEPIYALIHHDELAFETAAVFWQPEKIIASESTLHELLAGVISLAAYNILQLHEADYYPYLLQVLRCQQRLGAEKLGIQISYTLQEMTKQAVYQRFYDPLLGEAALAYSAQNDPRWSDVARRKYLMYAAAAAAQVGRLQEAERLRREAGRVDWYLNAIYEAGYAVGLARKGEFRAAARWARGIADPSWRTYALAGVAAELKKRGQ
ncbi:MAG: hypothetical protein NZ556_07590 [Fimbriimonadales bacterium]|nr:hypothetical protein [Fimbriimonadales bacterium]